jgi:uncharacterized membrane protein (DUF106 family)
MKGMFWVFALMILSLVIASAWTSIPVIKDTVTPALNSSVGVLLNWNPTIGMIILTAVLTLITTLLQKFFTDQDTLKQIKEEQKLLQQEMKLAKDNPQNSLELSKKSMELTMKAMPITMKPFIFTIIPFVLLLRWMADFYVVYPVKIFGFLSGIWAYIVFSIIISILFKKLFKVH